MAYSLKLLISGLWDQIWELYWANCSASCVLVFLCPGFYHHAIVWFDTDGFSVELVFLALKFGTAYCCETSVSTDGSTLNQNSKTVWRVKCAFSFYSTEWATKKYPAFRFARVLVIFCLALVCVLRSVFEQLVNIKFIINSIEISVNTTLIM